MFYAFRPTQIEQERLQTKEIVRQLVRCLVMPHVNVTRQANKRLPLLVEKHAYVNSNPLSENSLSVARAVL
ncbi:MAG TPA: hypothetical protein VEY68_07865 [Anoxybacillus sp.]|nr:hypothetical protein [Anoxybacillus sp.]